MQNKIVDRSVMVGVKLLGEYKLVSNGTFWDVFVETEDSYLFTGRVKKITRESNNDLYERFNQILEGRAS